MEGIWHLTAVYECNILAHKLVVVVVRRARGEYIYIRVSMLSVCVIWRAWIEVMSCRTTHYRLYSLCVFVYEMIGTVQCMRIAAATAFSAGEQMATCSRHSLHTDTDMNEKYGDVGLWKHGNVIPLKSKKTINSLLNIIVYFFFFFVCFLLLLHLLFSSAIFIFFLSRHLLPRLLHSFRSRHSYSLFINNYIIYIINSYWFVVVVILLFLFFNHRF